MEWSYFDKLKFKILKNSVSFDLYKFQVILYIEKQPNVNSYIVLLFC